MIVHRAAVIGGCWLLLTASALASDQPSLPPPVQRPVDYRRDVEPIFRAACFRCHGEQKQRSGFRLDLGKEALKGGDLGKAILPNDSANSPLIRYVAGLEPDLLMPPSGEKLTPQQIAILRAWIDQGAPYPEASSGSEKLWWSLQALRRPAVPTFAGRDQRWVRNPVDAFVLSKLREKGLNPSPEADRRTLMRRLYYDLIGLPPTPEELDAFVADAAPDAYERLVERLLASPHHGERWARHWLDVVHFGETHGYDKDQPRPNAWPYRDYVIRAFNDDRPYSRFVQEQLAGDVMFPGSRDGLAALGFLAAGPWDLIGHAEVPETKIDGKIARHLDRDDMIANTIGTFNSLTVHCAQCHNHKFDPIPQEDYYRLQAVFAALDRADRPYDVDPALAQCRRELERRRAGLEQQLRDTQNDIRRRGGVEWRDLEQVLADAQRPRGEQRLEFGYHSAIEATADRTKWVQIDLGQRFDLERFVLTGCYDTFNNIGAGFGFPVRYRVEVSDDEQFQRDVIVVLDRTKSDVPNPGTAPQIVPARVKGRHVRVTATRLAPRQNDFIFALAELAVFDREGKNRAAGAKVTSLDSIEALPRWSRRHLVDGIAFSNEQAAPSALTRLQERREELLARLLTPEQRKQQAEREVQLLQTNEELQRLPKQALVYAGTVHTGSGAFVGTGASGGKPRPIHLLTRGDVNRPGKEVSPGALRGVTSLSADFTLSPGHAEGERRVALARWLTDPRNPLTWRSLVNRVWQYHFGKGIVDSPNDFGRMGQLPTHPELLDWLAVEFRDNGQSIKQLHRLLVTSATYRQASVSNPAADKIDVNNNYLWRMPRRRLEAEAIRDSILTVSGKLQQEMGGPSFRDFVIERPEHSPHYQYHLHDPEDVGSHRRAVYRFLVRSKQQPFMATLDCADPSMAVDKRNEVISPLQALTLLNNQLSVVMARHFAQRVQQQASDPAHQVRRACRLALGRLPTPEEELPLLAYLQKHGLANTCRVILNLNEFVFVD